MEKRTITLNADGLEVTFGRRTWVSVFQSLRAIAAALEEMNKADLAPEVKEARLALLRMEQQDRTLSETVQDWQSIRDKLSVAGFAELEKAVDEFSKAAVIAGN